MATFPVKGVESIELGPLGVAGALPSTGWVKIVDIEDGSVSFAIPEANKTKVRVEDKPGVWAVINEETDGATVTAKSLDFDPKKADLLFKGDVASAATTDFSAPIDQTINVTLAVRITTKAYNGFKMVFTMPKAAITARFENALTKTGGTFLALGFTAEALTPSDAEGVALAPYKYVKTAVA